MFRREDTHWWYAGMRHAALVLLRQALRGVDAPRILDAGCGTGGTTAHLASLGRVTGVDVMPAALELAASRGLQAGLAQASVDRLPFRDEAFDAAVSFEVLYHLGVASDAAALAELRRVLRPGGALLLRLPAHDWLRGAHDRLVHTRHRYTLPEVRSKLAAAGFQVEYATWANSLLFPPAAAKRLAERVQLAPAGQPLGAQLGPANQVSGAQLAPGNQVGGTQLGPASQIGGGQRGASGLPHLTAAPAVAKAGGGPRPRRAPGASAADEPDLWQPSEAVNRVLRTCVALEALAFERRWQLPFGLSVIALARRAGG